MENEAELKFRLLLCSVKIIMIPDSSLQQALADREQMLQQNFQLQHRLAEHFRKKKTEETRQEVDKNVTDSEQRYVKYMGEYHCPP